MFGYVMANKPELKVREFDRYKAYYCGLCRQLKKRNGRLGQLTLTYDMTFLVLLLSSLYEPEEQEERHRCLVHPGRKQRMVYNKITDYAADMNVLLSYYHFVDDWEDERKLSGLCGSYAFSRKAKKIARRYPRQAGVIKMQLARLAELEKSGVTDLDEISRPFGELMSELFVYEEDAFMHILRRFGFFIGKYIYLLDAFLDLEKDKEKGSYNPFKETCQQSGLEKRMTHILDTTARQAVIEFEKLPLDRDLPILRNILYEGVKVRLLKYLQEERRSDK